MATRRIAALTAACRGLPKRTRIAVLAGLLVTCCVALAPGRMNSFDGSSQLAQAVHVCATGTIGTPTQVSTDFAPRHFGPALTAKVWYDANDVGSTLLMLPAGCIAVVGGAPDPHRVAELTSVAKVGSSLTFALLGGLAAIFVLLALAERLPLAWAWWGAVAFLITTGFLGYVKSTNSVGPAAAGTAAVCWLVIRSQTRDEPRLTLYGVAVALGFAGLNRFSLLPFATVAAALALYPSRERYTRRQIVQAAGLLVLLTVPTFVFNAMRSGHFWEPGQAAPQFGGSPALTASYVRGLPDMIFGLDRGLLFYAPLCFLGFFAALNLARRQQRDDRAVTLSIIVMALAYVGVVSIAHEWRVFGWGPRYLIPLLPPLFVVAVYGVRGGWLSRPLALIGLLLGCATQLPLLVANWSAVLPLVGRDSRAPNPIVGLWRSALDGVVHGRGFGEATDPRALEAPDTFWWHGVAAHLPHYVGLFVLVGALAACAAAGAAVASDPARAAPSTEPA